MRLTMLPVGEDGYVIDDPLAEFVEEQRLPEAPDHSPAAEARREADIAAAMALLND